MNYKKCFFNRPSLHRGTVLLNVGNRLPKLQSSWGHHGAHLGPVGPRWAPWWPHEPCFQGQYTTCFITHVALLHQVPISIDRLSRYMHPHYKVCAIDSRITVLIGDILSRILMVPSCLRKLSSIIRDGQRNFEEKYEMSIQIQPNWLSSLCNAVI